MSRGCSQPRIKNRNSPHCSRYAGMSRIEKVREGYRSSEKDREGYWQEYTIRTSAYLTERRASRMFAPEPEGLRRLGKVEEG